MTRPGVAAQNAVTLVAKEFLYEPLEATAGAGEVTFVVRNEGAIEHNFILQDTAQKKVAEIAAMPLAVTRAASVFSSAASFACSAMWFGVLLRRMYFCSS